MQREHKNQSFPASGVIPGIACMLLMFQAYLVAPLLPTLVKDFDSSLINLAIPAFAIPFAIAAAGMVFLRPAVDLRKCFLISLVILCVGTYLLSITTSASTFLLVRVLKGFGTGFMLPSALLLAVEPYGKKRSLEHMVLIIFALATGMTFGPSLGGWLNGVIGWRCLYQCITILVALLFLLYFLRERKQYNGITPFKKKVAGRTGSDWKSRYIYSFVYLTGVFHSGVFVWISYYFTTQYGLDEFHIATDLFIFGLPGFAVTILLYRYQLDKKVITILYFALGLTIIGLVILMGNLPLWLAECLLGIISIGFGCSQPLFIGIIKLPARGMSALGLVAKGSGILFAGYGTGPIIMSVLIGINVCGAMVLLILLVLALAYISPRVWIVSRIL